MLFVKTSLLAAIGLGAAHTEKASLRHRRLGWREDLPWRDLISSLSPDASLVATSPVNYIEECSTEFDKPLTVELERSNHGLIDQPSGLCLPHFFCAFDNCYPNPSQNRTLAIELNDAALAPSTTLYSDMDFKLKAWVDYIENPSYNLPSMVLFPKEAKDVVAAIKFAKEHGLEISVKNSGHSVTGASSKGNTLHINMNKYSQYATNDGVLDCEHDSTSEDLGDQPCRLSLAKGKSAVIRVGGGENWDKTYKAVKSANEDQEGGYKYHAVGGAAGTVSPMGWTFSCGLSGTTAGRTYGFGVDQVLQIEMVLPNGHHVKFGPTEWEEVEGYDVPKTLSVSGACNSNPGDTEDKWAWKECPEDVNINFDDLWFAVRGGGGGTWGVITSMYLQLHDYLPLERITMRSMACVGDKLDTSQQQIWDRMYQTFEIKFLLDPASINVTEEESNACGWPMSDFSFSCYGEGSGTIFNDAWKNYMNTHREILEDAGIPSDIVDSAISCKPVYRNGTMEELQASVFSTNTTILSYKDYAEAITMPEDSAYYPGETIDSPPPEYTPFNYQTANVLIPRKWILENIDVAATYLPPNPSSYRAFGGKASASVSDQLNSLSTAHRDAGYMFNFPFEYYDETFFSVTLPDMYDMSDGFPGFIGANHAGINTRGPLKEDWTKPCPLEWTRKERDDKCISLQEAIWGTKLLKQLEEIKEAIDPDYMFDCNGCVGNNRVKSDPTTPADPLGPEYTSSAVTLTSGFASLFFSHWSVNSALSR